MPRSPERLLLGLAIHSRDRLCMPRIWPEPLVLSNHDPVAKIESSAGRPCLGHSPGLLARFPRPIRPGCGTSTCPIPRWQPPPQVGGHNLGTIPGGTGRNALVRGGTWRTVRDRFLDKEQQVKTTKPPAWQGVSL